MYREYFVKFSKCGQLKRLLALFLYTCVSSKSARWHYVFVNHKSIGKNY